MGISIATEVMPKSVPKKFRPNGRKHYNIKIYLKTDDKSELLDVSAVQYELHPTFKQRTRISENLSSNFEINIWTWGYFELKAKLYFRSGGVKEIAGRVEW